MSEYDPSMRERFDRWWARKQRDWGRKQRPALVNWWKKRGQYVVSLILLLLGLGICFHYGWLTPRSPDSLDQLLPVLLTAGVFLVSIPGVYLINRHFEFRSEQQRRRDEYASLQASLVQYLRAFWRLRRLLTSYYDVDATMSQDWEENALELMQEDPEEYYARTFLRALFKAGERHWKLSRPHIEEKIIAPWYLDELEEHVLDLAGLFHDSDYYKPLFAGLGKPLPSHVDIRTHQLLPAMWASKLQHYDIVENNEGDPTTVGFWEDRFNKAVEIIDHMQTHASYIFSGPVEVVRYLLGQLGFLTVVCVLVPLGLLAFEVPTDVFLQLTYFSVFGFFSSLYLIGAILYAEVIAPHRPKIED